MPGLSALLLAGALGIAIAALEQTCLMAVGLGSLRDRTPRVRDALTFGLARAFPVFRLTALLTVRIILLVLPFAMVIGAAYWFLLRAHDINYYLSAHPPQFWIAAVISLATLVALTIVLARRVTSWLLVLPLVAFEDVAPAAAFGESGQRMLGRRGTMAITLVVFAVLALGLNAVTTGGLLGLGRASAGAFAGTLPGMLFFVALFFLAWVILGLVLSVTIASVFAMLVVRRYAEVAPATVKMAGPEELVVNGRPLRISWPLITGLLLATVFGGAFVANRRLEGTWARHDVLVFAHRGASDEAPENTLAAFRLAAEQGTDYIELDVQESSDGVVVVGHDADLMKVARSPLRIWQTPADQLRAVDIGSFISPAFADQRVPTLAEALEVARGRMKVNIELKDYGHDVELEQKVVDLVEAANMQDQIVTMSLSGGMVETMKRLRPRWTSGLLLARGIGDLPRLDADFLAVQASVATRRFVDAAHASGKPVYAWTVNDPQQMIRLVGYGVDGIITNRPAVAKEVVATYEAMSPAERLFLFVMSRLGSSAPMAPSDSLLRP